MNARPIFSIIKRVSSRRRAYRECIRRFKPTNKFVVTAIYEEMHYFFSD